MASQRKQAGQSIVEFALVLPLMLIGGLLGPLGVLILPQIPWALFAWIGSLVSRLSARTSES